MKYLLSSLILILPLFSIGQASKVRLPRIDGKIAFQKRFDHSTKAKYIYEDIIADLKKDTGLTVIKSDAKSRTIYLKGTWGIPVFRSVDDVRFKLKVVVNKKDYVVLFEEFYNEVIGISVDELIAKNDKSERKLVQKNLTFLRAGIQSRVSDYFIYFNKFK